MASYNRGFAIVGVQYILLAFVLNQSLGIFMNFGAKTPHHRKAPKRCKQFMENRISKIFFLLFLFFISCEEKSNIIEIYLTKKRIESYDGVPLKIGIKDIKIIEKIRETYGEDIRIDTIKNQPIYMGHFMIEEKDLEEKPFITNNEILGIDFKNSKIHFRESVTKKIYNSIPNWKKNNFFGKQFALCNNGKIILTGYFINSMSKYHSNTYQIVYNNYPATTKNEYPKNVAFSINDSLDFEENSLEKNQILYYTFRNRQIK